MKTLISLITFLAFLLFCFWFGYTLHKTQMAAEKTESVFQEIGKTVRGAQDEFNKGYKK